jgi:hypothetical protein
MWGAGFFSKGWVGASWLGPGAEAPPLAISTDFTSRQRKWLRRKWGIHSHLAGHAPDNRDWSNTEREIILAIFGINDNNVAPSIRDFTNSQRRAILRVLGIPDPRTLTSETGRDWTDKQRDQILRIYGGNPSEVQ